MVFAITICIFLLNGISNALFRGGYIKEWLPNFRGGKVITAALFGLFAYIASHNYIYAPLLAVAMYLGQMPAIFERKSDWYKLDGEYWKWSFVVFKRSVVWCIAPAIVTAVFYHWVALAWLIPAVGMSLCYSVTWLHLKVNKWALSEFLYGALLALPLLFI